MSRFDESGLAWPAPPRAVSADMSIWIQQIHEFRFWLAAAGRPPSTVQLRTYQLARFARSHPDPWRVTTGQMVEWLAVQPWGLETRRSHRAALTGFYRWAHATGRIETNPAALLPPIPPAQHKPRPAPEDVITEAIRLAEPRVRLMLLLAAHQGLRRGEIARVHSDDVQRDADGWTLRVFGKGRKERIIPCHDPIARTIRAAGGFAFPGDDHGHLSPAYVGKLMSRALPDGWTAHTLRHRFATRTFRGSRDLLTVGALLGHSRPETTQRYVQLPQDAMRAALGYALTA